MRFKIGRNVSGTNVEVLFESLDDIPHVIEALRELIHSVAMEETKLEAEALWEIQEGTRVISAQIEDNGDRVALSLLANWPISKSNADIVNDTGISRAGVYDQLAGRRGSKEDWFRQDGELYAFTGFGENEVVKLVRHLTKEE